MFRVLLACLMAVLSCSAGAEALKPWKGGRTPALELADPDGHAHRLADYRGKVVLVNFWATWCAPCRAEMPSIERLRQAMQGRPFEVLAVNVGESGRVAREFELVERRIGEQRPQHGEHRCHAPCQDSPQGVVEPGRAAGDAPYDRAKKWSLQNGNPSPHGKGTRARVKAGLTLA